MRRGRVAVLLVTIVLLLAPGLMMATVWTDVDLMVSVVVVAICVLVALYAPRWKWWCAIPGSILIAVPLYPYWLFASRERGWYFHFFHGYRIPDVPFVRFSVVTLGALLLFRGVFWALDGRGQLNTR